jgi:hypothetical protein
LGPARRQRGTQTNGIAPMYLVTAWSIFCLSERIWRPPAEPSRNARHLQGLLRPSDLPASILGAGRYFDVELMDLRLG